MIRLLRAYRRGYQLGQARARRQDIEFLRAQAELHHGEVGDQRRRAALNHAATQLLQGKPPSRPNEAR